MKNILLFVFIVFVGNVWGQIVQFNFPASSSLVVSAKDANITVSNTALSAGTIETNITTGTYFPNEPYIEESTGWTAITQASAKNYNFTITANVGYQFSITNISFRAYATAAGPSAFGFAIGTTDIYSVNAPDGSLVTVNQSVSGQNNLTSANIKIQGWLNGSRSSTGAGVFRLDDIVITGLVTPLATNYYWNGNNTSTLNGTWNNNTPNRWSQPTATTINATWPSSGSANIANFVGSGGGTITLPGTIGTVPSNTIIGSNAYTFVTVGANAILSSTINLGVNTLTIAPITGDNLTLSGIISGTGIISHTGAGTSILSDANTFSGGSNINNGVLEIQNASALGTGVITIDGGRLESGSNYTVANSIRVGATAGTSLSATGSSILTYNGAIINKPSNVGILVKQGGGTLSLGGVSTYSGNTFINNGTLTLSTGNNRLPSSTIVSLGQASSSNLGILDLNGRSQQIAGLNSVLGTNSTANKNTVTSSTAATLTINSSTNANYSAASNANSGIITGAITLVKSGTGIQYFGEANTYIGKTTINGGFIASNGENVFGTAPGGFVADQITLNGGGIQALGGNINFVSNRGINLIGNGNFDSNGNTITLTNVTTGTGSLTKLGSGTLIFNGIHTYSGITNLNAGTLQLTNGNVFPNASALIIVSGATFDLNSYNETIGSLEGAGTVTSSSSGNMTLNTGVNNTSTTFSGVISNGSGTSVALTKSGTGAFTLTGSNTYSGATTISQGTLFVNGSSSSGSAVSVSSGAILAGSGIAAGAVSLTGIISPGAVSNTIATLTTGAFTFNNGANYKFETDNVLGTAGTNWDLISAASINFAASSNITIELAGAPIGFNQTTSNTWNIAIVSGAITNFANATFAVSLANFTPSTVTGTFSVQVSGNNLNLVYTAPTNTILTTNATFGPYCNVGPNAATINFTYTPTSAFTSGVAVFTAVLSDVTGSFVSGTTNIGTVTSNATGTQSISATIPTSQTAGTQYRIRVISTSPTATGTDNGNNITINDPPTLSNAGTTQNLCNVLTATLAGNSPTVGIGNWTLVSGSGTITTTGAYNSGITGLGLVGNGSDNIFKWTITNGACTSDSDVIIHVDAPATISNAGTTQILCNAATTATLAANSPTVGTGNWSLFGGTGTITTTSSNNSGVTGLTNGNNIFRWTITNGACSSNNNVTITVNPINTFSPTTPVLCVNGTTTVTTGLAGTFSTILPAGMTIPGTNLTSWTINGNGSSAGSGSATFTTTSGGCTNTLNFTLNDIPGVTTAIGNGTFCGSTTITASGGTGGTIYYQSTTSNGTNTATASSSQSVSAFGTYYFRSQNSNGCWGTQGGTTVTINTPIVIGTQPNNATVNAPAPANFGVSSVTGTSPTYQWQVSTDGGISWNNVSTGTGATTASYTTATTTTAMSGHQYRCVVSGASPCLSVPSSVANLTVNLAPVALGNYPFTGAATSGTGPASRLVATGVVANLAMTSTTNPSLTIQAGSANDDNVLSVAPSSGNFGTTINTLRYIEFSATPSSGYTITPTSITFSSQRTGAGATSFAVRSSADSYAADIITGTTGTSYATSAVTLTGGSYSNLSVITFRIYPYGGSSTGFWRVDDIVLNGNINSVGTIATGTVTTSICAGSTGITVPFTYTPSINFPNGSATFTAQLSNSSGSFSSPTTLQNVISNATGSQSISATIPSGTVTGSAYRIRVVSASPTVIGLDNLSNISISNSNTSIAPSTDQNIATNANGSTLTVTEGYTATSRQWKYGTTSGGPYSINLGTITTQVPNFTSANTYYIVCESTYGSPCSNTVISNEVKIIVTNPSAEINLTGNSITIPNNQTATASSNFTDFGNVSWGATFTRTFRLQNTGTAVLNISGASPFVAITGAQAGDFSISTPPSNSIAAGSFSDFIITFTPSSIGARNATITINSDDADEGAYNFNIVGSGAPSNSSIIEFYTPSTTPQNIVYLNYQEANLTATSLDVMQFRIMDGGLLNNDVDNLGTTLNAITLNLTNSSFIRQMALYNGTTEIAEQTVSGSTVTFTGLTGANVTASDGNNRIITLKVSFTTNVTDNAQFSFTFNQANCTALSTGSQFTNFTVSSETSADRNRIEVTSNRLSFVTQPPSSTQNGASMTTVQVEAKDQYNRDLDFASVIRITSTGTLTGTPVTASAILGLATFSTLTHTVDGTGLTLNAERNGTLDWDVTSTTFNINSFVYATGDYRPSYDYTNFSINGSWEYWDGTQWLTATQAPQNISTVSRPNRIIIDKIGIEAAGNSSNTYKNIIIINSGELILPNAANPSADFISAGNTLEIQSGGSLVVNGQIRMNSTANLVLRTGGSLTLNNSSIGNSHDFWFGVENFEPGSNFIINNHKNDGAGSSSLINVYGQINDNTLGSKFGNLTINWSPTTTWTIVGGDIDLTLCQDLRITNPGTFPIVFFSNTNTPSAIITGNLIHESGILGLSCIFTGTSSSQTLTINGNLTTNAGTLKLFHNGGTGNASGINVNLRGNFNVASGATVSNDGTVANCSFNFNGTLLQTINVATTITGWRMFAKNLTASTGASIALRNQSLTFGNSTTFTIENKATFDFSFDGANGTGANPLNILDSGTSTVFTKSDGAILKISNTAGIVAVAGGAAGNIQTDTRTITNVGRFIYQGKADQFTGSALPTAAPTLGDKAVEVNLGSTAIRLIPSAVTNLANTDTLWIRQGIVDETESEYFQDGATSGNLRMTGGTYQISRLSSTVPSITGENSVYQLTGGTLDLDGAGDQILRGNRTYSSLAFSTSGIKTLSSALPNNSLTNTVTILDNATLDVASNNFNGTSALNMTGNSRFRLSSLNVTLPQLTGTYTLTGGTIELYGTNSTQTHSLYGGVIYNNIDLNATASNVALGAANIVANSGFGLRGTMNVNNNVCFQLASGFTITDQGSSSFILNSGSTLKYGGTIAASGITGNIQTDVRTFPSNASYGFVGNTTPQIAGTGLPNSMVSMYLDKINATDMALLPLNVNVTGSLVLGKGLLDLNNFNLTLGTITSNGTVSGESNNSYVIVWDGADNGNIIHQVNATANSIYKFPMGDLTNYTPFNLTLNSGMLSSAAITGSMRAQSHPQIGTSTNYLNRYWIINQTGITGSVPTPISYGVDYQYSAADVMSTEASLKPFKYNPLGWQTCAGAGAFAQVGIGSISIGSKTLSWSGITTFSEFTGIGNGSPLPIELLSFNAIPNQTKIDLIWSTASEINNDYFTIEKSKDAVNFEEVCTKKGAGNSNTVLIYMDIDKNPFAGVSYYRLKQTDFNGDYTYSDIVPVSLKSKDALNVYWVNYNAETGIISGLVNSGNKKIDFKLYDLSGRLIISAVQVIEGNSFSLQLDNNIPRSIYLLHLNNGIEMKIVKVN